MTSQMKEPEKMLLLVTPMAKQGSDNFFKFHYVIQILFGFCNILSEEEVVDGSQSALE